jgi:D-amino peptidase
MMIVRVAVTLVCALCTAVPTAAQQPLKVFISADMEGVAGAVTPEQLGPSGFEYQRFREFMTAEVNAAIDGARAAGATEIVVADSHGNMQNLLIERLPADVWVVRGTARPLGMMHGIDSTFHAAIFIGYHAGTTNLAGVRAHTFASARYTRVALNGRDVPESLFNAALAGHFGVPVVAISGDDVAVRELLDAIPGAAGAVVKRAVGFHAAESRTPEAAQRLIRETVRAGVQQRARVQPFRIDGPYRLDLGFRSYRAAEILAYLPTVERTASHTIRHAADSLPDVARFLAFIGTWSPDIEP